MLVDLWWPRVSSASAPTWIIRYIYLQLQFQNNVIIIKTKVLPLEAYVTIADCDYHVLFDCIALKHLSYMAFRYWAYPIKVIPEMYCELSTLVLYQLGKCSDLVTSIWKHKQLHYHRLISLGSSIIFGHAPIKNSWVHKSHGLLICNLEDKIRD